MEIVKLKPATKNYIWAGNKLKKYGKDSSEDTIAECWELSFHKDGLSIIDSGKDKGKFLKDIANADDLGEKVKKFSFFPCLVKLIDSNENLSVQVHPSDDYALKNEGQYGKTEMWYILDHEKGSGIYVGLKEKSSKPDIEKALKSGSILEKLNFVEVNSGDCFFIKSGTIHAIGKGITLIEIQQNSNLTYRLYDYNRLGKDGKPRELHVNKALDVIDYNKYEFTKNSGDLLGKSKYFVSYRKVNEQESFISATKDSFVSFTIIEGEGTFNNIPFKKFDTFFVPAGMSAQMYGKATYILTEIE